MNNITLLENINRHYNIKEKKCCRCGINGTSKRYKLTVKYSYPIYICAGCRDQIGSMALVLEWANKHIHCDNKGHYWFSEDDNQ